MPVSDVTGLYLGVLFAASARSSGITSTTTRTHCCGRPGSERFAKSKGGHLLDDVREGRVGTIDELETYILELCGVEQGLMIQNLLLASEALGLGSFTHYAAHRFAWTRAFGFQMRKRTFAQVLHKGFLGTLFMRVLRKNIAIPQAVGLCHDGRRVQALCAAVLPDDGGGGPRVRRRQVHPREGHLPGCAGPSAWRDPALIQSAIPEYSEANIQAVIAYCEIRHEALRPVPCELRTAADADGRTGTSPGHCRSTTTSIARGRTPRTTSSTTLVGIPTREA